MISAWVVVQRFSRRWSDLDPRKDHYELHLVSKEARCQGNCDVLALYLRLYDQRIMKHTITYAGLHSRVNVVIQH